MMSILNNSLKILKIELSCLQSKFKFSTCNSEPSKSDRSVESLYQFSEDFPAELKQDFIRNFSLVPNFISSSEEATLFEEIHPTLKRMRYEFDHWDNAIQGFREIEKLKWTDVNAKILERMKESAFGGSPCLEHAHVLDLDEKGHIKPHIDSVRFCGGVIAGLSLLSDAVMRLQKDNSIFCDVLLKQKAMYIMRGTVRLEYTHEVLPNEKSFLNGLKIHKKRRISIILRSQPEET